MGMYVDGSIQSPQIRFERFPLFCASCFDGLAIECGNQRLPALVYAAKSPIQVLYKHAIPASHGKKRSYSFHRSKPSYEFPFRCLCSPSAVPLIFPGLLHGFYIVSKPFLIQLPNQKTGIISSGDVDLLSGLQVSVQLRVRIVSCFLQCIDDFRDRLLKGIIVGHCLPPIYPAYVLQTR